MIRIVVFSLLSVSFCNAEENCDRLYYGEKGKRELPQALKCFAEQRQWDYVVLMYLNGEGAPRSLPKAEAALREWKRTDPNSLPPEWDVLAQIIKARSNNPKPSYARLDYCKDVARTTLASNACQARRQNAAESLLGSSMDKIKARLKPADAALFGQIISEFNAFETAEEMRVYLRNAEGSLRGSASLEQGKYVRKQFANTVRIVVVEHGLKAGDQAELAAADRSLDQAYEQGTQAQEAEQHWIKYRDLWEELARSLYRAKPRAFDPAAAIATRLTRIRVSELQFNPFGGC